jgi:hypothetical protein
MHQGQQECCRGENILEAAIAQDDVKWLMSRQDQKKAQRVGPVERGGPLQVQTSL